MAAGAPKDKGDQAGFSVTRLHSLLSVPGSHWLLWQPNNTETNIIYIQRNTHDMPWKYSD